MCVGKQNRLHSYPTCANDEMMTASVNVIEWGYYKLVNFTSYIFQMIEYTQQAMKTSLVKYYSPG